MKNRIRFRLLLPMLLAALVLSAVAPGVSAANAEEKPGGKRPTVLLILDGYGLSEQTEHNAIALADTPDYVSEIKIGMGKTAEEAYNALAKDG